MIEQRIFEYLVNSLWQLPLLMVAMWLAIRIARPGPAVQHALWFAVLVLAVGLPLRGIGSDVWVGDGTPRVALVDVPELVEDRPVSPLPPLSANVRAMATLRLHSIRLQPATLDWLVGVYSMSIALGLARLVGGWLATERMVSQAAEYPLTMLESTLLRACAERVGLAEERLPEVRFLADDGAGPMVAGVRRPVLLLTESLRQSSKTACSDSALAAVLLHELTHVRRRDYLANLLARVVALPIAYHPATHLLHRRIRQTREMICDATAAGAFASKSTYARSLLALAEGIARVPFHVEAVGLFDSTRNLLEERIMKLTESKIPDSLALRCVRVAAGTLVLVASSGTAASLHLKASTPFVYAMQTRQSAPAPQVEPASDAAPTPPVAPAPQATQALERPSPAASPAVPPRPAPEPQPAPKALADQQTVRELTPQERKELDEQMVAVREQMKNLKVQLKDMKPIVIPKIDVKIFESPEFAKKMADVRVKIDSPDFRKQMDQIKLKMESPEFKKQMEEVARAANFDAVNSPEFKRQMDEIARQVNSPEFKQQMEWSKKLVAEARADDGRRTAEMRKQLAEASAAIAEAQKQVHDAGIQKQLDEAQRRIQEAVKPF